MNNCCLKLHPCLLKVTLMLKHTLLLPVGSDFCSVVCSLVSQTCSHMGLSVIFFFRLGRASSKCDLLPRVSKSAGSEMLILLLWLGYCREVWLTTEAADKLRGVTLSLWQCSALPQQKLCRWVMAIALILLDTLLAACASEAWIFFWNNNYIIFSSS